MYTLKNMVVIVTGGSNGIGEAVVRDFIQQDAKHIAIIDVDEVSGTALEKELLTQYGNGKAKFIKCDVTDDEQLVAAYDAVMKENGYIDVVVNSAGIANEDYDSYRKEIAINYTAVVASTLKALQIMRTDQGGKGGTIINISSIAALYQLSPTIFVYAGTKSAVLQFSTCIGMEGYFSKTGVRVLTLCFGRTETNILKAAKSFDPDITCQLDDLLRTYEKDAGQSSNHAAKGVMEAYKNGESGSTWLVKNKKIKDITNRVKEAYGILSKELFN